MPEFDCDPRNCQGLYEDSYEEKCYSSPHDLAYGPEFLLGKYSNVEEYGTKFCQAHGEQVQSVEGE